MKTILLSLLISITSFAQSNDSILDIVQNKRLQESISQEMRRISNLSSIDISFEEFIEDFKKECTTVAEQKDDLADGYLDLCESKLKAYEEIGDVQTILDLQVAELGELQSSFFMIKEALRSGILGIIFLPIAIAADLAIAPMFLAYWLSGDFN